MVSYSDKSSLNLDESSLNTKTPAVDRKDMTKSLNPGQTLVRVKDQRKAFEGNLKQPLDMDNQKLNGDFSNTDIEMEIIPDLPENLLGINTTSLRSWKRILRNPNLQSSSEVSASQHHPRKRPPITPTTSYSPSRKKQVIRKDTKNISKPICGGPCHRLSPT